jgi:hypothetical protein
MYVDFFNHDCLLQRRGNYSHTSILKAAGPLGRSTSELSLKDVGQTFTALETWRDNPYNKCNGIEDSEIT